jgi:hypothetical protein
VSQIWKCDVCGATAEPLPEHWRFVFLFTYEDFPLDSKAIIAAPLACSELCARMLAGQSFAEQEAEA